MILLLLNIITTFKITTKQILIMFKKVALSRKIAADYTKMSRASVLRLLKSKKKSKTGWSFVAN